MRSELVRLGCPLFFREVTLQATARAKAAQLHETGCPEMTDAEDSEPVVQLITTKSDAEIAEDLKQRLMESIKPVLEIFDEAAAAGLAIQWESLSPGSPRYKHEVKGLRIVKYL